MVTNLVRTKSNIEVENHLYVDNADNDMAMILFQPDRPVVEGEMNYQQQLNAKILRRLVRTVIGKSTLLGTINPVATDVNNEIRLHNVGVPFFTAIDGIVKTVYAYDSPALSVPEIGGNRVTLPNFTVAERKDLVYLEIWFEEVMALGGEGTADTTVYLHGMQHGFTAPNTIKINAIPELTETARRIQLRGKIRTKVGEGLEATEARTDSSEFYTDRGGFFAAGNGTDAAAQHLNSVDGFAYAIPLVKVTRGANAATMTGIEVVAPNTATLQELANATLKDFVSFSTTLTTLSTDTTTNKNNITAANTKIISLETADANLVRENTNLRNDLAILRKIEDSSKYNQVLISNNSYVTFLAAINENFPANVILGAGGSHFLGENFFTHPANHRLVISKVYATLPDPAAKLELTIRTTSGTTVQKVWSWLPKLPNGGTIDFNYWQLVRDEENQKIEVPEFDGIANKVIHVRIRVIPSVNITSSTLLSLIHARIHIDFIPL